ncbi:MAG: WD40 repeat domain-containing protein, partial [Verrucomicrobiae bacterium]|nr:WD40 repeat domain-containing protein [Verrucomicrobiae bacterium]
VSRFEPSPDPPDAPSRGWLAFAFSPDSQRLAGARVQSNLVQVMDLATSRVLHEWGSAEAVTALAWDPTGRVVVTGNRVGQVVGTELPGLTHAFDLSVTRGGVRDLAVSPDGKFLAVSGEDRVIRCLSLDRLQAAFVTHGDAAKLAFTADGRRLGAIIKHDEAGWIELVESESYAARRVGQTSGAVTDFCLTEPGPLIACASPTGLRLLRAGDLMPVGTSRVGPVRGIAFQPSVASLWMAADEGILRWRVKDVIEGIQAFTAPVQRVLEGRHWADVALNSDGRLMALTLDVPGEIRLCDPASPAKPALVLRHAGADFVTFSPDTRWLATGSSAERRIRVWSLPDGTPALEVIAGLHPMAAFSPDGRWLATYGENFTLRDTHRWQVIPLPDFGRERPTPGLVAFSPDNRVLALLLDQQVIQLLRLPDLQPLAALRMPRLARAHQMAFSADARLLLVSGSDATLLCWRLPEVRARLAGAGLDWEN